MIRRMRHIFLNAIGRGYPPIIFIEPGEDPTKDRQRMISPINTGRIITIAVMLLALCPVSFAASKVFFKPKPVAAAPVPEGTAESTAEATGEATLEPTEEMTPTPIVIVITATHTPTETPTSSPTPTHTFTPTATHTPAELWPLWMTATQFEKDFFSQNQEATDLPYWRVHVITATPTTEAR